MARSRKKKRGKDRDKKKIRKGWRGGREEISKRLKKKNFLLYEDDDGPFAALIRGGIREKEKFGVEKGWSRRGGECCKGVSELQQNCGKESCWKVSSRETERAEKNAEMTSSQIKVIEGRWRSERRGKRVLKKYRVTRPKEIGWEMTSSQDKSQWRPDGDVAMAFWWHQDRSDGYTLSHYYIYSKISV